MLTKTFENVIFFKMQLLNRVHAEVIYLYQIDILDVVVI